MESMIKTKSVGAGMVRLLDTFCEVNNFDLCIKNCDQGDDNVTFDKWLYWLKCVDQQYNKEGLGLEIAKLVDSSHIGICAYMANSCESLPEYLPYFIKYTMTWYNYTTKKIFFIENEIVISWSKATYYSAGLYTKETAISEELQVAIIYQRLSKLLDVDDQVFVKIELSIPKPKDTDLYEKYFKCPVFFNMDKTSIFISKNILNIKKSTSDKILFNFLAQYADEVLDKVPKRIDFIENVKAAILKSIVNGHPTIYVVAEYLNLPIRSLQNKLKSRNVTFQELMNEIRLYLAKKYLLEDHRSILEVSHLLGYKEQTSFIRAFKTWTGESPMRWREKH